MITPAGNMIFGSLARVPSAGVIGPMADINDRRLRSNPSENVVALLDIFKSDRAGNIFLEAKLPEAKVGDSLRMEKSFEREKGFSIKKFDVKILQYLKVGGWLVLEVVCGVEDIMLRHIDNRLGILCFDCGDSFPHLFVIALPVVFIKYSARDTNPKIPESLGLFRPGLLDHRTNRNALRGFLQLLHEEDLELGRERIMGAVEDPLCHLRITQQERCFTFIKYFI